MGLPFFLCNDERKSEQGRLRLQPIVALQLNVLLQFGFQGNDSLGRVRAASVTAGQFRIASNATGHRPTKGLRIFCGCCLCSQLRWNLPLRPPVRMYTMLCCLRRSRSGWG